ncbi:MAG: 2-oxoglutarate dehydrogenase complex dihydrolipoyllysine-residue succinyltransferase [Pseudomonadales bacterium]|nr:2-oxoglutarate dehydrogenase complex dihydrolipoyllysine-residue succinyltransferase [Pseudomonadales bacterium]
MSIEIKAPAFPESVPDGTIATWYKKAGEAVTRDELLVDIETDKVLLEVVAPADGVLKSITKDAGEIVVSHELLAVLEEGGTVAATTASPAKAETGKAGTDKMEEEDKAAAEILMSPAARKLIDEHGIDPARVACSGKDGRMTKEDVLAFLDQTSAEQTGSVAVSTAAPLEARPPMMGSDRPEQRVAMTRLRAKVAERLLQATHSTAMLTTFNEVNMQEVMNLRSRYKEMFEKKHEGVRLGFMSFFVRASVEALKRFPAVNASIDGNDMIYHGYQDIGVAVSSPRGLVVPVLRDADTLGFADIERAVMDYGIKARDGKLAIEEMMGGTFTISNGGVFGSLLSTPILNPPQTAILGMHKIQDRPMAVNGEVRIQPMMYLALSYDHRMIDGREAVQFLVTIKELLEDPARIFLEV